VLSELLLYQKAYDILIWMFNKTDGFPKSKRFSIGARIEAKLLDMITGIYRLQYAKDGSRLLHKVSLEFDEIKLLLKISHDAKLMSRDSFAYAAGLCGEIGGMIGGLLKAGG
jgi:hypothetical protein